MRKLLAIMALLIVSVTMSQLVSAEPADAASVYYQMGTGRYSPERDDAGEVFFYPYGDIVKVCDIHSDGAYVEVDIWNMTKDPNVYEYGIIDQYNDGECRTVRASMGQPYNMAEGHCFSIRIRIVDGATGDIYPNSPDWARWRNYNDRTKECPGVD